MQNVYQTLNNGSKIPQMGFGVYLIEGDENTKRACLEALKLGCRHIDTAHAYQNERGVRDAVWESGIPREEIWLTSKLWPSEYGAGKTMAAIDKMLDRLGTTYIDLLLLHQQFGDYPGAWRDMEKAVSQGKVQNIGLSNFESDRLEEVFEQAVIKPAVLQVECHPYYQQQALKQRIEPYGTALECWYPIGHGDKGLMQEPLFKALADKYGKTAVQIILRWHIQEGNIIFPKTTNPLHMQENFDIFDFCLNDQEIREIGALDCGKRFFTMSLEEQERVLGGFTPAD